MLTATPENRQRPLTLGEAARLNGVAFADHGRPTMGNVIAATGNCIRQFGCNMTALWDDRCSAMLPAEQVRFASAGGTMPTCVYRTRDVASLCQGCSALVLTTDGQVPMHEVESLGAHALLTAHLRTALEIMLLGNCRVRDANISVHFAHFTRAQHALLVIVEAQDGRDYG